jgi:hypothetical protein
VLHSQLHKELADEYAVVLGGSIWLFRAVAVLLAFRSDGGNSTDGLCESQDSLLGVFVDSFVSAKISSSRLFPESRLDFLR